MLTLPGVRTLMVLMFFARIPATATSMALTLHVAIGLGRGYGAAGLVGAAATIGIGIGAPYSGRIIDRFGLRTAVVITTVGETAFWATAPLMPYELLLPTAFVGGLFAIQAMSIGRQAIAALVPESHRRAAYSMDSISIELSFMIGPVVAVALATQVSTSVALQTLAVGCVAVGVALFAFNPPVRGDEEAVTGERPPRREWLTSRLIAVLVIGSGALFVLAGTEVTVVAVLRAHGEVEWTGAATVILCLASVVGGLVHGAVRKSLPQVVLMALLGALTIPVLFVDSTWWVVALALAPASAMCAPALAATGEQVSRLVPAAVRGEATGLQSSAFTFGAALGSPAIGFVVDHSGSPGWGFVGAGAGGLIVAAGAALLVRRSPAPVPKEPAAQPS
ncbi:MFS transporter [Kibdelosporangium persicum]|uniref:Aspartate--tRNA ligase n=1 Tax=Kibdelosporangium persicum TaxID=2698649 RepID=A0ABX2F4S3_9PSEU|nr:MFS transporter [Kibdelosporangium persicum]NRN66297.1 Aspartate--tRNA ligase [Kibdelosporangium persicum]